MEGAAVAPMRSNSVDRTLNPMKEQPVNVTRYWDPDAIRLPHVVMILLIGAMLAGAFLLLSVPESTTLVDGAVTWQPNSALRAVVQLLCMNYDLPARHADAIKSLVMALFTGAALAVVGFVLTVRPVKGSEILDSDVMLPSRADTDDKADGAGETVKRQQIAPLIAAQMMAGLYLVWMLVRSMTSPSWSLALGATALTATHLLWAAALGLSLTRAAARLACWALVGVTVVAAAMAIWYFYGRNPNIRAKFPFGNPTFLAACLLPAIMLCLSTLVERVAGAVQRRRSGVSNTAVAMSVGGLLVVAWAFLLTNYVRNPADSGLAALWAMLRSFTRPTAALVGLIYGVLTMAFLLARGRGRWATLIIALVITVAGAIYARQITGSPSEYGRDATARLRFYGWGYAVDLFEVHPVAGGGPGAFTLGVDSLISRQWRDDPLERTDVEEDPRALGQRLGHAHNEWLEILSDLGSVGFVLVLAVMALTFLAGINAIESDMPAAQRWMLMGLLGALVAMVVEECFGVGLRMGEVPPAFFTVLGLTWALSSTRQTSLLATLSNRRDVRIGSGAAAFFLAVLCLVIGVSDFSAARENYEAAALVREDKVPEALDRYASAGRQLRPDRALQDMLLYCEASLMHAHRLQGQGFQLSYQAQQSNPPQQSLLEQGRAALDESRGFAETANRLLRDILSVSQGFMGASRLYAELNLMGWEFAQARGRQDEAASYQSNAANSLRLELARQPFDLGLAVDFVRAAGPTIDFESAVVTLARPLRHTQVTPDYVDFIVSFSQDVPGFEEAFAGVFDRCMASLQRSSFEPADRVERWAPEIVRLGGVLQLAVQKHKAAADAFGAAVKGYETFGFFKSAPMGSAYAVAELADAQFLEAPETPDAAIATLDRALELAPRGEEGDNFRNRYQMVRKISYLLAGGREDEARKIITEIEGTTDPVRMDQRLSDRYAEMCYRVLKRRAWELPDKLGDWVARAVQLDPGNIRAHMLTANLAMLDGGCAKAIEALRNATKAGARTEDVLGAIRVLYGAMPDCDGLKSLWTELAPDRPAPELPQYGPEPKPVESESDKPEGVENPASPPDASSPGASTPVPPAPPADPSAAPPG